MSRYADRFYREKEDRMSTQLFDVETQPASAVPLVPGEPEAFMSVIARAATDPGVDVEKMQKLWEIYKNIVAWNAERAFNSAFSELQAKLPVITEHGKIEVGGQVRSEYARFEDINDVLKPLLAEHGFGLMFKVRAEKDTVTVIPILLHKDGYREVGEPMELGADTSGSKNSVQSMGSSTSYGKRYSLIPFLNITTRGEDDDGQAGAAKTINEDQVMELQALLTKYKVDQREFLTYFKIPNLTRLPVSKFADAVAALHKKYGPKDAAQKGSK